MDATEAIALLDKLAASGDHVMVSASSGGRKSYPLFDSPVPASRAIEDVKVCENVTRDVTGFGATFYVRRDETGLGFTH